MTGTLVIVMDSKHFEGLYSSAAPLQSMWHRILSEYVANINVCPME